MANIKQTAMHLFGTVTAGLAAGILSMACAASPAGPELSGVTPMKYTAMTEDGRYRNRNAWKAPSLGKNIEIAWDFLFVDNNRIPDRSLPVTPVDLSFFNTDTAGQFNVTWLGHSSLMIHMDGHTILTDPVFETRVSLLGPSRFNGNLPMDPESLGPVDVVIISHNHYDHLNKYSVRLLKDRAGVFIVPTGLGTILGEWGVPDKKIVELSWWEEYRLETGLLVAATPSQHFSGRGLTDRNKTLWASWVMKTGNHSAFFSGDSGYFDGFKEIGASYGPFDMTFIECGAYDDKWRPVHMYPEETVQAHMDLGGKVLHPVHWATFNLGLHPWYDPMTRLVTAADRANIRVVTPIVGDTTLYGTDIRVNRWWEPVMAGLVN